jgi:hypothetical protein
VQLGDALADTRAYAGGKGLAVDQLRLSHAPLSNG